VTVQNNYALSSQDTTRYLYPANQEDSINFYKTNGTVAQNNYISGAGSSSGCGLITDDGSANNQYIDNTLYNTGQCAIGIATGTNQTISGNRILNLNPVIGGGNTAFYIWNQYASSCSGITVSNNQVSGVQAPIPCDPATQACTFSSYWDQGNCGPVTGTGNTYDNGAFPIGGGPVYQGLVLSLPGAAPPIPPRPQSCTARSPYTTQISSPLCN
jgi:hypothetical protein